MTFLGALYKLFIGPLELFFEVVFVIANRLIGNLGLSIIVLSLVMNFLVLPLYKRADAMQEEQRETEKRLKKWVTHIKKTFKGDERFMMLQTYYRQNGYKPSSILKGSVSLLLEIPFFIAAYNFLSHAGVFNGFSFGPFADMGQPDGLIKIGTLSINLLPILMTTINIVSSMIYTKGLPTSSKVQLYGMAGIFLVLLYNSPAALVFYWTLNNLFSLVKNLFYKMKNPRFVLGILSSVAGLGLIFFIIFIHSFGSLKRNGFVVVIALLLQLPICLYYLKKRVKEVKAVQLTKTDKTVFYAGVIFLALLTGVLIPSAVIKSSPEEFINLATFASPLGYVLNASLLSFGTFVVWFSVFYLLASDKGKKVISLIVSVLAVSALINYMFFGKNLGNLSSTLIYDKLPFWTKKEHLINILVLVLSFVLIFFIWKKRIAIIKVLFVSSIICFVGMSTYNLININSVLSKHGDNLQNQAGDKPHFSLSKNGKNVMVIMMDRAVGHYLPFIFNEKPEIAKQFEGFTYYPNTVSFGPCTNIGAPGLYGGYEYTPMEMNKRDNESLENKHNESIKLMPVLFDNNDFDVTVFDPTYAGYNWIPDLTIYDEYPDINKYITMGRVATDINETEYNKSSKLNRDFFLFSICKSLPLLFQYTIYDEGKYNKLGEFQNQECENPHKAKGIFDIFYNSFAVLKNLSSLTNVNDSDENTFLMMSNDATHSPCLLQEPEYIPAKIIDNTEYDLQHEDRFTLNGETLKVDNISQMQHYHVNVAGLMQLGNYFDFMRENGVYDNTKIIIVADHGSSQYSFDDYAFELGENNKFDVIGFNPLFMVKDFNSKEFTTDNTFMTNADVPTIAFKDLIENPVNPFTGKEINDSAKYNDKQYIFEGEHNILVNNGNTFLPGKWYSVHDNIFDKENWEYVE